MEGDKILLSQKQLQRFRVAGLVGSGRMTVREAAEKLGVCYRQARRICKRVREKGAQGLLHGNIGRSPQHRIPERVRKVVVELSEGKYRKFNDRHFWEKLREEEGIILGRETVRKILRAAGFPPKRKRRPPRHRKRRDRSVQEGAMVLWDGSPHQWFGPDHPPCCLMCSIDDARGNVVAARFFPFEGSEGYLWLLRQMVTRYGIPLSMYMDCHSSLKRNDSHWTLEEELAGRQTPTQVGQAIAALGIHPIFALSPQAKGRIERLFETLQDRLVAELELAKVKTLEAGTKFLPGFLRVFNRKFSVPPAQAEKAWRAVPEGLDIERAISFHYPTKVGLDNTVRVGDLVIDIRSGPQGRSYARARAEVRQLLDGSWRVYYKNDLIARHPSTAIREPIRALPRNRSGGPSPQSPHWVYRASAQPIYDGPNR